MDNYFVNAQERHKQYPATFGAPTQVELDELKTNDIVKVCVNDEERFWAVIKTVKGQNITAVVDNDLICGHGIEYGDTISFKKENVFSIFTD